MDTWEMDGKPMEHPTKTYKNHGTSPFYSWVTQGFLWANWLQSCKNCKQFSLERISFSTNHEDVIFSPKMANIAPGHHSQWLKLHLPTTGKVIFNRQPSLHKMSMMGHRAKVRRSPGKWWPWRWVHRVHIAYWEDGHVLRFNGCKIYINVHLHH